MTKKQEEFAKAIVDGMNQADAYRYAYDAENMSDNAIYREASLLVDNPKVAQRIQELRDKIANEKIMSAQKRMEWLTELILGEDASYSDRLKAIDIMNKMQGEYVQKVEADVNSKVNITVELVDE